MSLSEALRAWWWAPGLAAVARLEATMASQEARLQESIGRLSGQADAIVAELHRISGLLAVANERPEIDLSQEIEAVDALADRLDAEVPDAEPVEEPPADDEPPVVPV